MDSRLDKTRQSYDHVAVAYAAKVYGELADKPYDRAILDTFAAMAGPIGPVCDLGCGPGHVAHYLRDHGLDASGIDLSPGMVEEARRLNPGIEFQTGSMLDIPLPDASLGGIAAFYCIIHVPKELLPRAFAEMRRVLRPGGALLLAFHEGEEVRHVEEWFEREVSLDFAFYTREEIEQLVVDAGFEIVQSESRPPYPDVEVQTQRAYIVVRRPPAVR